MSDILISLSMIIGSPNSLPAVIVGVACGMSGCGLPISAGMMGVVQTSSSFVLGKYTGNMLLYTVCVRSKVNKYNGTHGY